MKIKILPAAIKDLEEGFKFYAKQAEGLGDYFLDSLFADIDSFILYGGIHPIVFDYYRLWIAYAHLRRGQNHTVPVYH